MLDKAVYSAFESRLNYSIVSYYAEWLNGSVMILTTGREESTGQERSVTAVAGSAVKLDCKFDDVDCRNQPVRWLHYRPSSDTPVYWRRGDKIHPSLESTNVSFEDNPARGRSVLTIPRVRFEDHGRFECLVGGVEQCRMNFRLSVTGKYLHKFQ